MTLKEAMKQLEVLGDKGVRTKPAHNMRVELDLRRKDEE